MARPRHTNKHIEDAIKFALENDWRFEPSRGHAWGRLKCPHGQRHGCCVSVYSTPKRPEAHAKDIRRAVISCPHKKKKVSNG